MQAIVVKTPEGSVLWDCLPLLHPHTAAELRQRGGLKAIAISHPHFYTALAGWAEAFECPVSEATSTCDSVLQSFMC